MVSSTYLVKWNFVWNLFALKFIMNVLWSVAIGNFLTRKREDGLDETDFAPVAGMKKLGDDFVGVMFDNTDRKIGIGFVGKYLDSDYNDLARRSDIRRQLDELARNQHR